MKFWQRQLLLSVVFCLCLVFFLHSRTPDTGSRLQHSRDIRAELHVAKLLTPSRPDKEKEEQQNKEANIRKSNLNLEASVTASNEHVEVAKNDSTGDNKAAAPLRLMLLNQTAPKNLCPGLVRPQNVEETEEFQKVDGDTAYLEYSAFLDVERRLVRIVGLSRTGFFMKLFCLLWYRPHQRQDAEELMVVQGGMLTLPEHHSRTYAAHYIQCPLPDQANPYAVSVTLQDCRVAKPDDVKPPTNVIRIVQPPTLSPSEGGRGGDIRNFTVCVTALNFRYSRAYELVEMIELNRLLGAELLTFYVNSVGDNVQKVLSWYEERGIVKLLNWKLPIPVDHWPPAKEPEPEPQVHYFAQLASHNDCLNRHRGVSRYLAYLDLDEFIVPKKTTTWAELLTSLHHRNKSSNCYLFRCVFFRKDWPLNSENYTGRALADKYRSVVLSTVQREPTLFDYNHRAKYIVDPQAVDTVGIHNIWTFRKSEADCYHMDESDAILHHYRSWENPLDSGRGLRDTDMYRFKEDLLKRLDERWAQLPKVPLDIPISEYGQV